MDIDENVLITGCFDILHLGHFRLFEFAREQAGSFGIIHVYLDSDQRVKKLKGESRPINDQDSRKECLSGIGYLSGNLYINIFDTDEELVDACIRLKPIRIIGSDYKDKPVVGGEYCDIIYFDRVGDFSTTNIIAKSNA